MPGPPTPMPLPQSFLAMLIPVIDPQRNGTAMHLQVISYFSRGLPIQAHQNPLDAQHYSRFLILLCLASNFQQLGDGGLISVRECWAHIAHHCSFFGVCRIIYAHLYSPADLSHAELWLCKAFIEGFEYENPALDLSSKEVLRGIFSRNIQRRKYIMTNWKRTLLNRQLWLRQRT